MTVVRTTDEALHELAARVRALEQAQRRRKRKLDAKLEHEAELAALERQLKKEHRDVTRMQGLAGLLFHLAGNHAERLDKEQREEVVAQLRVESKRALLAELDLEIAACPVPGPELSELRATYEAALDRRRQALQVDQQAAPMLQAIEAELEQARVRTERLAQLHAQASGALAAFQQAHAALVKATKAASADALDLPLINLVFTHAKYQLIEVAHGHLRRGELLVAELATELDALADFPDLSPEIGTGLRIADITLDWFSIDYNVMTRIEDSAEAVSMAVDVLEATHGWIDERLRRARQHQENLASRREHLLSS